MSDERVSIDAITQAPDVSERVEVARADFDRILDAYSQAQINLETARAEVERLTGSAEAARATLIKPYAWAVLWFLCGYGAVVALLLMFQGFKTGGFHIHDGVMGVLVGSTAVSAIGLVHTVVKGLFPGDK